MPLGHPMEMWQRQVPLVGVEGCRWGGQCLDGVPGSDGLSDVPEGTRRASGAAACQLASNLSYWR